MSEDDLTIEEGPSGFLGPIGDGKIHFRISARQTKLNVEARENLLREINARMAACNGSLVWKLKYALDKAEFARTHVLTEDLDKVEDFLREASRLVKSAIEDFRSDAEGFYSLADVARQVKQSEVEK